MKRLILSLMVVLGTAAPAFAETTLKVFTWPGYVQQDEIDAVNELLAEQDLPQRFELLPIDAEGPEQMFTVMRQHQPAITFLTLNYIQMQDSRIANMLRAIDVDSPRLTNYQHLSGVLARIPMGMRDDELLYIPWGGGAYGIWADADKVSKDEMPRRYQDLLDARWQGNLSLTRGQIQPNVAIALMSLGQPPFLVNDMVAANADRSDLVEITAPDSPLQDRLNALYDQVGHFWEAGPEFSDELQLVASYGPGVAAQNAEGGNWQLVDFEEGSSVWLDTINFTTFLDDEAVPAAEIFANYFIGKAVQERVVNGLGMVAASSLVESNPLIEDNPDFFAEERFWPPYMRQADNLMQQMSERAMAD